MKTWLTAELPERYFKHQPSPRPRPAAGTEQRVVGKGRATNGLSRELSHRADCQQLSTDTAEPRQPFQRGPVISTLTTTISR